MLTKEMIDYKSQQICKYIIDSSWYQQANKIFTFVSMGTEVNTRSIIIDGLNKDKTIAVPKVYPKQKKMIFSRIQDFDDLEIGHFGVLEPSTSSIWKEESDESTIFIVPGLIFDLQKYRIGYGGGYYDRYLSTIVRPIATIGIGYDFQVVPMLPKSPHDVALDWIVTEKRWI